MMLFIFLFYRDFRLKISFNFVSSDSLPTAMSSDLLGINFSRDIYTSLEITIILTGSIKFDRQIEILGASSIEVFRDMFGGHVITFKIQI